MRVTRTECRTAEAVALPWYTLSEVPIQVGLGGSPWRVLVASSLLCRARREQIAPVLGHILKRWPTWAELGRADGAELEGAVRPCGLHRQRARQLQRMAVQYQSECWEEVKDLPGVGAYVSDCVGVFCLGRIDGTESTDKAVLERAAQIARSPQRAPHQSEDRRVGGVFDVR